MLGDHFPKINHDSQGSGEQWGRYLPWTMYTLNDQDAKPTWDDIKTIRPSICRRWLNRYQHLFPKKKNIHIIPYHIPSIFHPSPINNHKSSPKVSLRRCSLPSKPSLPSFGSTLPVVLPVLLPIQILPSFSGASGDGCLQRVEILWLQNPKAVGNYWQPWNTVTILFFCNFIVNIWLSLIGKWMKVLEPDILPVLK